LGMTCDAGKRTRAVWLQAPPGTGDLWVHRPDAARDPVTCRFAALPNALSQETAPQLERLASAR
ncbi:MAG: hypothetical protein QOH15_1688, partial [Gaiellales bacterium]|nr:hypothetical protein [Gaiellales bacterium]